ncbi:sulfurtransferase [Alcaligenaceae bacterium]|nr:sulfurtransferase [Alcaligenaceae bacterium]
MTSTVTAATLKQWLVDGKELALLDVNEHGEYGEAHLFFAVPAPYSELETSVRWLVPRRDTRIVIYDSNAHPDGVAHKAARRLRAQAYTWVHILEGGLQAWLAAGYRSFAGVNVPSKAFGELVEHRYQTPRINASELAKMQAAQADLLVLDGRPVPEYRKMNIPGASCCPNGELALRASSMAAHPETLIVINCAGRTRSIIGAQTLIDSGITNPVKALENGTQGWYLADLPLEHGSTRYYPDAVSSSDLPAKQQAAALFAEQNGVACLSYQEIQQQSGGSEHTVYWCDIRTEQEFATGTLPGARHAPGGQLIQATDQYLGTRNACIVVFDTECVRAIYIAVWLKRMGWKVTVLNDAARYFQPDAALADLGAQSNLAQINARQLREKMAQGAVAIDLRPSASYRKKHIAGSQWSIRPRLADMPLAAETPVVLIVEKSETAKSASLDLFELGVKQISCLVWDDADIAQADLPCLATPNDPPNELCVDYLFFVHDRHDGNKAAARQYLAWETALLGQLDEGELAVIGGNL